MLVGICFGISALGFYVLWVSKNWNQILDIGFGGVCVDDGFTAVSSTLDYGLELKSFGSEFDSKPISFQGYQDIPGSPLAPLGPPDPEHTREPPVEQNF